MKVEVSVNSNLSHIWLTAETVEESATLLSLHTNALKGKTEFMLDFGEGKVVECLTFLSRAELGTRVER